MFFLLYRSAWHEKCQANNIEEEASMNSKIVLAALSLAIALSSAPVAMAGGKKETADPRQSLISLKKKSPGGMQNWCDIDANCNGWAQALQLANQGKLKY